MLEIYQCRKQAVISVDLDSRAYKLHLDNDLTQNELDMPCNN